MLKGKNKLRLDDSGQECMRAAGRFNAELLDFIRPYVSAGVSTGEIDRHVEQYTRDHGHVPAPLGSVSYTHLTLPTILLV